MLYRVTMTEKDYDTAQLAVKTLRHQCRQWADEAEDIDSFDHYAALMEDIDALGRRLDARMEVKL